MKLATGIILVAALAAVVVGQEAFQLIEVPKATLEERVAALEMEVYLLKQCDIEYQDDTKACFDLPLQHVGRCLRDAMEAWEECERPSPF